MGRLSAGVAETVITPPIGTRLVGYGARPGPSARIRDDLTATALVVDDGTTRAAVVACDLCYVHPTLLRAVRRLAAESARVPPGNVWVCCSHTHAGPLTWVGPEAGDPDRAYVAYLPHVLAGAVAAAARAMRPVRLLVGYGHATIGGDRRHRRADGSMPQGDAVDPDVAVLRLETEDGDPLATVVNYACHPVVLGPHNMAISADYVGEMRRAVAQVTGAPCLFVQGACADVNPVANGLDDDARAVALGGTLAEATLAACQAASVVEGAPVALHGRDLALPLAAPYTPPEAGRLEATLSKIYLGGKEERPLTPEEVAAIMDERMPWAAEVQQEEGTGRQAIAAEVGVLRIGDVAMAAIAAEPFVETGRAIKHSSPLPHTIIAGYTNGCVGYLPPRAAYPEGGYEVDEAYRWYRLPAPLAPGCEEQIVAEALRLLGATTH